MYGRKENMNKEIVRRFVNKNGRLVTEDYAPHGRKQEIQDDCIIFESEEEISAISLNAIDKIVFSSR